MMEIYWRVLISLPKVLWYKIKYAGKCTLPWIQAFGHHTELKIKNGKASFGKEQITRGNANGGVITVSIGYDIRYATEDVSLQGLYGRADRALFRAKQEGRNCIRSSYDLRERRSRIG